MIVVLMGPPGGGKGTQGALLKEKHGVMHVSTGDLLRQEVAQKTPLGLEIEKLISKGNFVPDELILEMLQGAFQKLNKGQTLVLDGYPRNVSQAKTLDKMLETNGIEMQVAFLDVPESLLLGRILKRGQELGRKDDNEEVFKTRVKEYQVQTWPVVEYYQQVGRKILKVNGAKSIAQVNEELSSNLGLAEPHIN